MGDPALASQKQTLRTANGGEDSLGYSESEQLQFSYPAKDRKQPLGVRGNGENQTFGMPGIVERDESG